MEISDKIQAFRTDLLKLDREALFEKYFMQGNAYLFEVVMQSVRLEYDMKKLVSDALGTPLASIFLVGSSKIGFSVSPVKLFQTLDYRYNQTRRIGDRSDLDVAIVNNKLFSRIGREVYNFTSGYRNKWEHNEYNKRKTKGNEIILCYKYFEYFTKGWFKLEYKPTGYDFCINDWTHQKLVNEIRQITNRQVNLAIYSSNFYFKNYHLENLTTLAAAEKINPLQNG